MKFKDSQEHEWNVSLTVGSIDKIKEDTEIDLDILLKKPEELANILYLNPRKLVEVLYSICENQIKDRQLSERDFASIFDRMTIDAAGDALIGAIVDFYPRSSIGQTIREHLPELLNKMDERAKEKTRQSIEKALLN